MLGVALEQDFVWLGLRRRLLAGCVLQILLDVNRVGLASLERWERRALGLLPMSHACPVPAGWDRDVVALTEFSEPTVGEEVLLTERMDGLRPDLFVQSESVDDDAVIGMPQRNTS